VVEVSSSVDEEVVTQHSASQSVSQSGYWHDINPSTTSSTQGVPEDIWAIAIGKIIAGLAIIVTIGFLMMLCQQGMATN